MSLANSNMQPGLPIRQQVASAVNLLVQASRMSDGFAPRWFRSPKSTGMEGEVVTLQDLFVFDRRGLDPGRESIRTFRRYRHIRPKFYEKLLSAGIRLRPDLFDEVVEVVTSWDSLPLAIVVWLAAMAAWYLISKYYKASS